MANKTGFSFNGGNLEANLRNYPNKIKKEIGALVDFEAARGEEYMKTHAPWIDQTGAARSGLFAVTTHEETRHLIVLAHAVNYGIYLEARKGEGRRPIILPSMEVIGRELMKSIEFLVNR